jgi:hypothetical protein
MLLGALLPVKFYAKYQRVLVMAENCGALIWSYHQNTSML